MRRLLACSMGAAAIGLLTAACGSSSTASASPSASAASASAASSPSAGGSLPAAAGVVSLRAISGIPGKALVDGRGRTLYLFEADKNGQSTCSGACAAA